MTDLDELLALAVDAAARAGELLVRRRPAGDLGVDTKSTPTDVVTAMDRASEQLIVDAITEVRPDDGFLGEEGAAAPGSSGVRWVIDPIDGTVNYLYDIPHWAVSIAAEVDGDVAVGVVLDPRKGELFTAVRGRGATRDGEPIAVREETRLAHALVATGFGYAAPRRARQAQALTRVLPAVRDIRRGGTASLDLCWLACGRVEGYYERGLQPWDLAAGGLIAREAGARVEGLHGRPAGPDLVLAASPALFPALHDLIAPLGVDSD